MNGDTDQSRSAGYPGPQRELKGDGVNHCSTKVQEDQGAAHRETHRLLDGNCPCRLESADEHDDEQDHHDRLTWNTHHKFFGIIVMVVMVVMVVMAVAVLIIIRVGFGG